MDELLPPDQPTAALDALLVRWRENGDIVARDALIDDSQRRTQRIVRKRLNSHGTLRDIVSENTDSVRCLVLDGYRAWTESAGFKVPPTLRKYFAGVAEVTRTTLSRLRKKSESPSQFVPDPKVGVQRIAPPDASLDERIDDALIELANQSLKTLSDQEREAFDLRTFGELKPQEIADVMGLDYQRAYRLVMRALAKVGKAARRIAHPDNFDNPTGR